MCIPSRKCALAGLELIHFCFMSYFMKMNDLPIAQPLELQQLCQDVLLEKYAAPGETSAMEIQVRVAKALAKDSDQ